jgi:hypothetical protein
VKVASVLGRRFSVDSIAAMLGGTASDMLLPVEELLERDLLAQEGEAPSPSVTTLLSAEPRCVYPVDGPRVKSSRRRLKVFLLDGCGTLVTRGWLAGRRARAGRCPSFVLPEPLSRSPAKRRAGHPGVRVRAWRC